MIEQIKKLEKMSKKQRKDYVIQYLLDNNIPYSIQDYDTGCNVFSLPEKLPFIGIGSHYDFVPNSPGANDNLSALVVTLDLLMKFKEKPLENIGVCGFFFDEEENGLVGSSAYIKEFGIEEMIGLYNMELVGSGNIVALWSVDSSDDSFLLKTIERMADEKDIGHYRFDNIITNNADHSSFRQAGLIDSFTITSITMKDIEVAGEYYEAIAKRVSLEQLYKIMLKAPVFKHYHQPTDKAEHLDEKTLRKISNLIEVSIKEIDEDFRWVGP
jgi:Zn-dependent M28 family amino/carboxypeptidase